MRSCDEDIHKDKDLEALNGLGGPMTRARTKKAQEALNQLLISILKEEPKVDDIEPKWINWVLIQEDT